MIEVQMGQHDHVHVAGLDTDRVQTVHEEIGVGEARERIGAQEAGHGAGGEAGVEEDGGVSGAHEVAGNGDAHPFRRALPEEETGLLEPHEAVLERVEPLDGHLPGGLARRAGTG